MESSQQPQPQPQLSADAKLMLKKGISLLLSKWSPLQMAVNNEWGGHDSLLKSEQLTSDIFAYFTDCIEEQPLEALLFDAMSSLNAKVEGGGIVKLAEFILSLHDDCLEGHTKILEKLKDEDLQANAARINQAIYHPDLSKLMLG